MTQRLRAAGPPALHEAAGGLRRARQDHARPRAHTGARALLRETILDPKGVLERMQVLEPCRPLAYSGQDHACPRAHFLSGHTSPLPPPLSTALHRRCFHSHTLSCIERSWSEGQRLEQHGLGGRAARSARAGKRSGGWRAQTRRTSGSATQYPRRAACAGLME